MGTIMDGGPGYRMCAYCWHFVEPNDVDAETRRYFAPGELAEYVHLDDGEKDHDHDAVPGDDERTLSAWADAYPGLFVTYADEKTGPNSAHFTNAIRTEA